MQANSHRTMGATSGAGTVYPSGAPEVFSDVYFAHYTPAPRRGEGGILFYLCLSVQDIFRHIFLSNC